MKIRLGPVAVGAATAAAAAAALTAGTIRWNRDTAQAIEGLNRASGTGSTRSYSPKDLAGLPVPVARYFEFALTPGRPMVQRARFDQRGQFAMKPGEWRRMRASQTFWAEPPGFVWDASIALMPGLAIRVRDGYFGGSARMKGAVAGLVPVVDQQDSPGLAEGALLRYLAEAPLVPTALLPAAGVQWSAVDDSTARASLSDAGITVAMDVHFAPGGAITRITAERYRDSGGQGVLTLFEGEWTDYHAIDGMMIPSRGRATWLLPGGPHTFWRAEVTPVEVR